MSEIPVYAEAAIGDATPIMVGKHYLAEFGAGAAPRVLFVPDPKRKGKAGPPLLIGDREIASVTHACDVYVRGAEDGSDLGRFDAAYALSDLVQNMLKATAPGRLVFGPFGDNSPLAVDAYGAEDAFSFTYARAVPYNDAVYDAAYAAAPSPPVSPTNPDQPNGNTGAIFGVGAATFTDDRSP